MSRDRVHGRIVPGKEEAKPEAAKDETALKHAGDSVRPTQASTEICLHMHANCAKLVEMLRRHPYRRAVFLTGETLAGVQDEATPGAGAPDREGDSLDVAASEVSAKMHRKREKLSRCSSSLAISRDASCSHALVLLQVHHSRLS